jgi:hypothetical protein
MNKLALLPYIDWRHSKLQISRHRSQNHRARVRCDCKSTRDRLHSENFVHMLLFSQYYYYKVYQDLQFDFSTAIWKSTTSSFSTCWPSRIHQTSAARGHSRILRCRMMPMASCRQGFATSLTHSLHLPYCWAFFHLLLFTL